MLIGCALCALVYAFYAAKNVIRTMEDHRRWAYSRWQLARALIIAVTMPILMSLAMIAFAILAFLWLIGHSWNGE